MSPRLIPQMLFQKYEHIMFFENSLVIGLGNLLANY